MISETQIACENCKWYVPPPIEDELGSCYRFPPVPIYDTSQSMLHLESVQPSVEQGHHCGEFVKKDE